MNLLGLSDGEAALVPDEAERTGKLTVVHLGLTGALPPGRSCLTQEQLLRKVNAL